MHFTTGPFWCRAIQPVTGKSDPPRCKIIIRVGNKRGDIGKESAITFQRMPIHLGNGPIALLKLMRDVVVRSAWDRIFQQWMVGDDGKAVITVFFLYSANESCQERLNQLFRLNDFTIFLSVNSSQNAVTMHDFFHVWRRNEIAFLGVNF